MRFETIAGVASFDRAIWNRMAETASPMMDWEYYFCLEQSASASPERGYQPRHLVLLDGDEPVAVAPLFERDRAWVEFGDGGLLELLTEMTGYPFHRGIVGTIPFTPVPGYQFLHRPDVDGFRVHKVLLDEIDVLCARSHYVTSRLYFVAPTAHHLHSLLHAQGYVCLRSDYFLWKNHGYATFEDFLKTFRSARRTKIKRELRTIQELGIDISMVPGAVAPASWFADMFRFYLATWTKHMGHELRPFLNDVFFRLLGEVFRHRLCFSVAARDQDNLAMAIFYEKAGNLYGRYWGTLEQVPFLHFATCYYQAIRYAIERRMHTMDPGFGGEHKLYRGYEISPAYHYIKFHGATERRVAYSILNQIQSHRVKGKKDW
jgi:predicted N-acyltransferase